MGIAGDAGAGESEMSAELDRLADSFDISPMREVGDRHEIVRAVLRALVGPVEWRIDSPEGAAIMAQRRAAYVAACRQIDCGRADEHQGTCARCADMADHILEAWIGSVLGEPTNWYADVDFPDSEIGKRHVRGMTG